MDNDLVLELYLQPASPLAAGFRLDAFNAIKPRVTHSPSSDVVDIWDPTSIIMEDRHVSPAVLYIQVSVLQVSISPPPPGYVSLETKSSNNISSGSKKCFCRNSTKW